MNLIYTAVTSLAIAMPAQGPIQRPTAVPVMSAAEMNRQLTTTAKSSRALTFSTLFALGVHRVKNESASLAFRSPSWLDGYGEGWVGMNGTRGGSNTTNEKQSIIDIRYSTNKPNVLHALVIPISRGSSDTQEATFEIRFGTEIVRKTIVGTKHLMATWTPTRTGMLGASVKMITPGKFSFSQVLLKYANE